MRILIDHQVFSWQHYGGISRYFIEQIRWLTTQSQEVLLPGGFFSENVYLRQLPGFHRKSLLPFSFRGKKILQNWLGRPYSLHAIRSINPDVFHPSYFDPYFLNTVKSRGIPFVLTVHDMIHERYGHGKAGFFSLDAKVVTHKALLVREANAIVAVSENTKKDLLQFYPDIDPAKVQVIPHGNSLRPPTVANSGEKPYLLFVGQRKGYKNFEWMVENLAELLRNEKELELHCVGGGNFTNAELELFARRGISGKVKYLAVASDDALAKVYALAACFIFPSRYEGFGIPVLEAFACGCPVLLNRTSSLPEVGGDAAAYFEESFPEGLGAGVHKILHDRAYREQLIRLGLERVQAFTWEKSASLHLRVYQSVAR